MNFRKTCEQLALPSYMFAILHNISCKAWAYRLSRQSFIIKKNIPDSISCSFLYLLGVEQNLEQCLLVPLNPFTPKSDQFQISSAASPVILHRTVWGIWLFIAYSDERWLYYQFSLPQQYISLQEGWENVVFELYSWWASSTFSYGSRGGGVRGGACTFRRDIGYTSLLSLHASSILLS